jgi:hypothetical protein
MCSTVTYVYICRHTESATYACGKCIKNPDKAPGSGCRNGNHDFETKLDHGCHDCEKKWVREWRRRHGIRHPLPDRAHGGINQRSVNNTMSRIRKPSRGVLRPLETSKLGNMDVLAYNGPDFALRPGQVFRLLQI